MKVNRKTIRPFVRIFFVLYLLSLVYFMFFCDRYGRAQGYQIRQYNIVPFQEIRRFILNQRYMTFEAFMTNICGNIIAFMPLGMLLPLISKKGFNFFVVFGISLLTTFAIEVMQYISKKAFLMWMILL